MIVPENGREVSGSSPRAGEGRLVSINISGGGVPKQPLEKSFLSLLGLEGDAHRSRDHGGPDRAVCIYSLERIRELQSEDQPIDIGTAGENFTVGGLDWPSIVPGVRLRFGEEVLVGVTSFTAPCKVISSSFLDGRFKRISQKVHPGWSRVYARVLRTGHVTVGDPVRVVD